MEATHEKIKEDSAKKGHNKDKIGKELQDLARRMADIDAQRKNLNGEAAEIRDRVQELGFDKDAFRDEYGFIKKGKHQREGYKESREFIHEALAANEMANLFDFLKKED